jgi:hypothetical protein
MARRKDPNLESVWRQRLQRQSASGLSISAFCAQEGVSSTSFQTWKRRLAARSLPSRPQPPLFVPLHLDPDPRPHPAAEVPTRVVPDQQQRPLPLRRKPLA